MLLLLSIVIGTGSILARQLKIVRGMENSVVALSAADAGIERVLTDVYRGTPLNATYVNTDPNYNVSVVCCSIGGSADCHGGAFCPAGLAADPNCHAFYLYCIKSTGTFNGARRVLQVNI